MAEYSYIYIYTPSSISIHLSTDTLIISIIVNNTTMNTGCGHPSEMVSCFPFIRTHVMTLVHLDNPG